MEIRFLSIETAVLAQTVEFYQTVLEIPVLAKGSGYAVFQIGGSISTLRQAESGNPFYHFAFDIPQNQIDDAQQWLESRVPLLTRDGQRQIVFEDWNATSVYFHDPSGNIVEMIARHNLANDSQTPFDAHSLMSISEIGWPYHDLKSSAEELALSVWRDYGLFRALGSETGLILLVPVGRGWLPTGRPAEAHRLSLLVKTDAGYRRFVRQ